MDRRLPGAVEGSLRRVSSRRRQPNALPDGHVRHGSVPVMNSTSQLQLVNSMTYADLAALNLGLTRFPGEKAAAFLQRCYQATTRRRDHSYEGTQDELCLQLDRKSTRLNSSHA